MSAIMEQNDMNISVTSAGDKVRGTAATIVPAAYTQKGNARF